MSEMCFDKLEDVELSDLPRLTRFCAGTLIECKVLKQLRICSCPEFKTFISCPDSANMTVDVEPGEVHYSRESDHNAVQPLFDEKVTSSSILLSFPLPSFTSYILSLIKVVIPLFSTIEKNMKEHKAL
jgi:hypothetical protein